MNELYQSERCRVITTYDLADLPSAPSSWRKRLAQVNQARERMGAPSLSPPPPSNLTAPPAKGRGDQFWTGSNQLTLDNDTVAKLYAEQVTISGMDYWRETWVVENFSAFADHGIANGHAELECSYEGIQGTPADYIYDITQRGLQAYKMEVTFLYEAWKSSPAATTAAHSQHRLYEVYSWDYNADAYTLSGYLYRQLDTIMSSGVFAGQTRIDHWALLSSYIFPKVVGVDKTKLALIDDGSIDAAGNWITTNNMCPAHEAAFIEFVDAQVAVTGGVVGNYVKTAASFTPVP